MSVAFDAVGPSSAGASTTLATSLTWLHNCSGVSRLLVVGVSLGGGIIGGSMSATYNSIAMMSARANNFATSGLIQLFYLVAPATGSNSVVVTVAGVTAANISALIGGSISLTSVDQNDPVRNIGSNSTSSIVIPSAIGNIVVDVIGTGSGVTNSNQISRWLKNLNGSSSAGNAAQSTASGAASVAMGYTITPDSVGIIAMDIQQIPPISGFQQSYQGKLIPAV